MKVLQLNGCMFITKQLDSLAHRMLLVLLQFSAKQAEKNSKFAYDVGLRNSGLQFLC